MDRRHLLKVLGISAIGVATVPLWMNSWNKDDLPQDSLGLTENHRLLLSEIVGTIIPSGNTPGAKELEVDRFIRAMVEGCFEKDVQTEFLEGFDEVESVAQQKFDQSFIELMERERIEVLETLVTREVTTENEEKTINFVEFVKELTVIGYMNSQYVMENLLSYEFVPGRFHGSFPVEETIYRNA